MNRTTYTLTACKPSGVKYECSGLTRWQASKIVYSLGRNGFGRFGLVHERSSRDGNWILKAAIAVFVGAAVVAAFFMGG